MALRGAVATSHPLAAAAGLEMMRRGGNAADAAVAAAATLAVVEPMSTGLGGDGFALVFDPRIRQVRALNASGRAPAAAGLEAFRRLGLDQMPLYGPLSVTVPGVVDGWAALLEAYGTMTFREVLEPAVGYARDGFAVTEVVARAWRMAAPRLAGHPETARVYLPGGEPPRAGQVFRQPDLARTLEAIARHGRDAFYDGEVAGAIARCVQREGGLLTVDDLRENRPDWEEPIWVEYRGCRVYECRPNGQGLIALLALNMLGLEDVAALGFNSPAYWHLAIEAVKLAFADGLAYIADPRHASIPVEGLLSPGYARRRRALIQADRAIAAPSHGHPQEGDTVYLTAVDGDGLAVSLINSLYHGFGSGIVAPGTGVCLQNRGALFRLDPNHPNVVAPGKRPYHTIIPAMVTRDDALLMSYGVMGGFMQPQGHVQVLVNILDFGMTVQEALDAPRFRYVDGRRVLLEPGLDDLVGEHLRRLGHDAVVPEPGSADYFGFGGGQVILRDPATGVLHAASEPRKDGQAVAF
ncbi:MAG TPA: gamma-glutamyltransferase [Bacillota bacterium]